MFENLNIGKYVQYGKDSELYEIVNVFTVYYKIEPPWNYFYKYTEKKHYLLRRGNHFVEVLSKYYKRSDFIRSTSEKIHVMSNDLFKEINLKTINIPDENLILYLKKYFIKLINTKFNFHIDEKKFDLVKYNNRRELTNFYGYRYKFTYDRITLFSNLKIQFKNVASRRLVIIPPSINSDYYRKVLFSIVDKTHPDIILREQKEKEKLQHQYSEKIIDKFIYEQTYNCVKEFSSKGKETFVGSVVTYLKKNQKVPKEFNDENFKYRGMIFSRTNAEKALLRLFKDNKIKRTFNESWNVYIYYTDKEPNLTKMPYFLKKGK